MKEKIIKWLPLCLSLVLLVIAGAVLGAYAQPMQDVSLDLSLGFEDDMLVIAPDAFDSKGWTVYTQEGDVRTELEPDGIGGYWGLELGQTFYFSRVMEEDLDSPTLQLGAVDRTFSIWLDDTLIYTDHPQLDNRIGQLQLPMNGWDRSDPIIISLPQDYHGKTLTIAQSSPAYSETGTVKAWPASVRLYCGYAYESGLISETFRTAILAAAAFLIIVILLAAFVRSRDYSLLCLALVALAWMADRIIGASFFWRYFGTYNNTLDQLIPQAAALALLVFLAMRAEKYRSLVYGLVGAFALSLIGHCGIILYFPQNSVNSIVSGLPYWLGFAGLTAVLILGALCWHRESWFYRVFIPTALAGIVISWGAEIVTQREEVWNLLRISLSSGQINYVYHRFMPAVAAAALTASIAEFLKAEIARRMEKHLLQQRHEMTLASYENIRRQHEEVMMLRHDMTRHFRTMQAMDSAEQVQNYLADLIGQNERISSVVRTGNETLDIILNSKLSAAKAGGIQVEIRRAQAPASLSVTDADLCSVMMNVIDNAVSAAVKTPEPRILLDVHTSNGQLAMICENSADSKAVPATPEQRSVQPHGLGLKIIRSIVEKYSGLMDTDSANGRFRVRIVIPLDSAARQ